MRTIMRHQLAICVLLIAASSAPTALADPIDLASYTINFTAGGGTLAGLLPTAGAFTYDPDTSTFTSFGVTWDGISFDLKSAANAPDQFGLAPSCISGFTGAAISLAILIGGCDPPPTGYEAAWFGSDAPAGPSFSFAFYDHVGFLDRITAVTFIEQLPFQPESAGFWTVTQTAGLDLDCPPPPRTCEVGGTLGSGNGDGGVITPPPPLLPPPVPEPSSLILIATVLVPLAFVARKRIARKFCSTAPTNPSTFDAANSPPSLTNCAAMIRN